MDSNIEQLRSTFDRIAELKAELIAAERKIYATKLSGWVLLQVAFLIYKIYLGPDGWQDIASKDA